MVKTCLNCIHKDVCIKRSTQIFMLFIQTGRYDEVPRAQANLDCSFGCTNWKGECNG